MCPRKGSCAQIKYKTWKGRKKLKSIYTDNTGYTAIHGSIDEHVEPCARV